MCWNPLEWIPGIVQSAALTKSFTVLGKGYLVAPFGDKRTSARADARANSTSSDSPHTSCQSDPVPMGRHFWLYCQEVECSLVSYHEMALKP